MTRRYQVVKIKKTDVCVYIDMDDTAMIFSDLSNTEEQLVKMYEKGFYLGLKPNKNAAEVIKVIKDIGIKVKILSGTINSPYCEEEKYLSAKDQLGMNREDVILSKKELYKSSVIETPIEYSVLVDDYEFYLDDWIEKGGIAIRKYRKEKPDKYKHSVKDLEEILIELLDIVEMSLLDRLYFITMYNRLKG